MGCRNLTEACIARVQEGQACSCRAVQFFDRENRGLCYKDFCICSFCSSHEVCKILDQAHLVYEHDQQLFLHSVYSKELWRAAQPRSSRSKWNIFPDTTRASRYKTQVLEFTKSLQCALPNVIKINQQSQLQTYTDWVCGPRWWRLYFCFSWSSLFPSRSGPVQVLNDRGVSVLCSIPGHKLLYLSRRKTSLPDYNCLPVFQSHCATCTSLDRGTCRNFL